jgi:hypothetical protein
MPFKVLPAYRISFETQRLRVPPTVPDPYTIALDADIDGHGDAVIAVRVASGTDVHFPRSNSVQRLFPMRYPLVRWIGQAKVLLLDARSEGSTLNASIVDEGGRPIVRFSIGDAVEDVVWVDNYIVATYFDEGVFGNHPLSQEGIAILSETGELLWGWNSSPLGQTAPVYDCYAAARGSGNTLGALIYTAHDQDAYRFGILDVAKHSVELYAVPDLLRRTKALTFIGDGAWLFAVRSEDGQEVVAWRPGNAEYDVARPPLPLTRGLSNCRFISKTESTIDLVTPSVCRAEGNQ